METWVIILIIIVLVIIFYKIHQRDMEKILNAARPRERLRERSQERLHERLHERPNERFNRRHLSVQRRQPNFVIAPPAPPLPLATMYSIRIGREVTSRGGPGDQVYDYDHSRTTGPRY